jgi:hypothetical protein
MLRKLQEKRPKVENSPPVKGQKMDKDAVRVSKQLHQEISSAMKNMASVMKHAFKE